MTEKKVHEGRVVSSGRGPGPLDVFSALDQVVEGARECFLVHQEERSKRERLRVYESTEIARIKAGEEVFKRYFDQVFAERRHLYDEMFDRLDRAMEAGDGQVVAEALRGIVDIAKSSPLADIGDLSQIRTALDDPDQVWEL